MPYHPLGALVMLCVATLALTPTAHTEPRTPYFDNCQSDTGANATVVLTKSVGLHRLNLPRYLGQLEPGDEVAAFTPEGLCVGQRVWTGVATTLTLWGDDPMTPAKDGYAFGDPITFRAWSASDGEEFYSLRVRYREEFDTSGQFNSDAVYLPRIIYFYPIGSSENARNAAAAAEQLAESAARSATPDAFALDANYPNPFRSSTTIRYGLPESATVRLDVYDALGRHVTTLVNEEQPAAWHEVDFRASDLAPGVYICRLRANDFVSQRQMMFVR